MKLGYLLEICSFNKNSTPET